MPLLFLDVDGVLLPFAPRPGAAPGRPEAGPAAASRSGASLTTFRSGVSPTTSRSSASPASEAEPSIGADGNPLLHRLDPADGVQLLALGCELVWATTWGAEANELLAPLLGFPALPIVDWPDDEDDPPRHLRLHWKTRHLSRWAAGRPFAWLDDELTEADQHWSDINHPAPALLRRVTAASGLTGGDFDAISRWVQTSAR